MDPATGVGLALGILPLIISALENYEYTFQPIIIFSRHYRKEVERFQNALKVQRVSFANECCFLLHSVTSNRGNAMIDDLGHALWREADLEEQLKARLVESYDGCVSALSLINDALTEILKETKTLDILLQKKHGGIDIAWLKRLRQRSKISFSKDRFDDKLEELESRIESLHKIRKHVEHLNSASELSQAAPPARITQLSLAQVASSRLHEVLSSFWQCETADEHSVNIGLEGNGERPSHNSQKIHFELTWSCPGEGVLSRRNKLLRLSVDSLSEIRSLASDASSTFDLRQILDKALEESLMSTRPQAQSLTMARPAFDEDVASDVALPDLRTIPNLCYHLENQPPGHVHYLGFLQKSRTFKHFICTPFEQSHHVSNTKSLEDALVAAKASSEGIPLPEKLNLAKILALAVLRFHSTPWLKGEWQSQDVVFFGIRDFAEDPLRMPYLKSRVLNQRNTTGQQVISSTTGRECSNVTHLRTPVRNQTLYGLGVMLIELAYDSPLQDLQKPEDDQGDAHTLYWAATRLGERVWRELGPKYADAVRICLHGAFGASSELEDMNVQKVFFSEVVQKLEKCAEGVVL